MRRWLLLWWALCLLVFPAQAHLGSPNVVLEGPAGPHQIRVVVQPPPTLPGLAEVSVRGDGLSAVSGQVMPSGAAAAAAPAVEAAQVAPGLYHAQLWFWTEGAQTVRVRVAGPAGEGQLTVPVQLTPRERPPISPLAWCGLALGGLGLAAFALRLVTAAALPERRTRAWLHGLLGCALAVGLLGWRWRVQDARFRAAAEAERVPVQAELMAGEPPRLRLTPAFTPSGWEALAADHGKMMHLFLIRSPAADGFAHLHPVRRDAKSFETLLPEIPAGTYDLYAEITRQDGRSETLVTRLDLPAIAGPVPQPGPPGDSWCQSPLALIRNMPAPKELDRDDSWLAAGPAVPGRVAEVGDGLRMVFAHAGRLAAGREVALRFFLTAEDGATLPLQLYMGMNGHCVVRRRDGSVFTHLHPSGTVSMAASEIAETRGGTAPNLTLPPPAGTEAVFPFLFPRSGEYRLWVQMQAGGRIRTGVFDVVVD